MDGPFFRPHGLLWEGEYSPLVRFHCMTQRKNNIFINLHVRPPKEKAMLVKVLNSIITPILKQQIPEIIDFFLSMEALS